MSRNYNTPTVAAEWASSRETDMAVAVAIHAVADSKRSPEAIWEAPTQAEWDHVTMAVAEYVAHGDFPAEDSYCWGQETIRIGGEPVHEIRDHGQAFFSGTPEQVAAEIARLRTMSSAELGYAADDAVDVVYHVFDDRNRLVETVEFTSK